MDRLGGSEGWGSGASTRLRQGDLSLPGRAEGHAVPTLQALEPCSLRAPRLAPSTPSARRRLRGRTCPS